MENKQLTTTPPTFTQKIGKTTYVVNVHFSETSSETFDDKIKRLMLNDLANLEESNLRRSTSIYKSKRCKQAVERECRYHKKCKFR